MRFSFRLLLVAERYHFGLGAKILDCSLIVSEFEIQSHYYVQFLTNRREKFELDYSLLLNIIITGIKYSTKILKSYEINTPNKMP